MAISEDQIRLVLDMVGSESVDGLTKLIAQQKAELKDLKVQLDTGKISLRDFLDQSNAGASQLGSLNEQMDLVTGKRGAGGRGILGASYAFQDFTSQIQNGFLPALASIQNNIPQILMGLGMGSGMAGIISAGAVGLGVLATAFKGAFGGETKEAIEEAKEKLKEFEGQVKKVHEAFLQMTVKPTTPEEEAAANLKAILEDRPNAERTAAAIANKIGEKRVLEAMSPEEMKEIGGINQRILSEEQIKASAQFGDPATIEAQQRQARQTSEKAEQERHELLLKVRRRIGEQTVVDATKAGPEGAAALRRLKEYAPEDITSEIEANSPDAIRKFDDEMDEFNAGNSDWKERKATRKLVKEKRSAEIKKRLAVKAKDRQQRIDAQEDADADWNRDVTVQDQQNAKALQVADLVERTNKQRETQAKTQQRQQQRAREVHRFNQVTDRLEDANVSLERGYKEELDWAKLNNATDQMMDSIHRRHDFLKSQIDYQTRFARRQHERVQESMMQGNDG